MRIRIHKDIAKLVDKSRRGKRTANEEVNMALAVHYAPRNDPQPMIDHKFLITSFVKNLGLPKRVLKK